MRLDPNFPPQFVPEAANKKGKSRHQQEAGSAPANFGGTGSAGGQGSSGGRQDGASIIDGEAEGGGAGASAGGSGGQAAAEGRGEQESRGTSEPGVPAREWQRPPKLPLANQVQGLWVGCRCSSWMLHRMGARAMDWQGWTTACIWMVCTQAVSLLAGVDLCCWPDSPPAAGHPSFQATSKAPETTELKGMRRGTAADVNPRKPSARTPPIVLELPGVPRNRTGEILQVR